MPSSPYLDLLDTSLRAGLSGLSAPFVESQVRFVAGRQQPDGGFAGRQGGSDLYYTDFALRTLGLLSPGHPAFARAAAYAGTFPRAPEDTIECFNLLNIHRLLKSHPLTPAPLRPFTASGVSAYHTFLAALCFQMLGVEMLAAGGAVRAIESLRQADGGYAESPGQRAAQTNATAAAVGFLAMHDALPAAESAETARFLASLQAADGGLRAHREIAGGDLLSTFTGLLTLWALDGLEQIDTAGAARFLRSAADPSGGFRASPADDAADVEYTYYGVALFALLRAAM